MSITPFSRYADNLVTAIVSDGISRPTIVITPPDERRISFSTYTWVLGDQIEYLAYSAYGDEQSWWFIADANPEILFWDRIPPGKEIRVPHV